MAAEQVTSRTLPLPLLGLAATLAAMAHAGEIGRNAPAMACLWLAAFALLILFCSGTVHKDGPRLFWPILALGVLLRAVFFLQMDAGNDIYRYVWEGWLQLQGVNPYAFAPDAPALAPLRGEAGGPMAGIWPLINHKDLSAVYPPLTQLIFRAAAAVSPTVASAKGAVLGFELLTLACVALLVRRRNLPDHAIALYALNPLVLLYFAGEGHVDAIMAGCTALAYVCLDTAARHERPDARVRWECAGFLLFGLAGMAKYLAVALLPFFVTRHNIRRLWWAALPLLLYVPFAGAGTAVLGPVVQFGQVLHFNDVLPSVLRGWFGGATPLALALGLLLTLAGIWLSVQERLRSAFLASLAVLVWLPTLHPWYLLLPAILLPLFPSRTALALMAVQVWTFAVLQGEFQTGVFQEIVWLRNLAALLPLALLLRALWKRDTLTPARTYPVPARLSVIIPVLNEAERLRDCLEALHQAVRVLQAERTVAVEVLVSDGGSYDDTLDLARAQRCLILHAPRGRGRQIAAATLAAKGEVLLILHADTRLERRALLRLIQSLEARPDAVHGALGMRFSAPAQASPAPRTFDWIAWLNAVRARLTDIAFGDQGQWIRRDALADLGGFPEQWLMEDVELSLRAKALGPAHMERWTAAGLTVSRRAWRERGAGPGVRMVLQLFFRYLLERRLGMLADDPQARGYYERYYGREAREPWDMLREDCEW